MAAPVVDEKTLDVVLSADGKRHSNPERWASISPFNVSITGDGTPQFRVRDPGGTWGDWRSDPLSVDGNRIDVTFPASVNVAQGEVVSSVAQTLTTQGHQIQVRGTSASATGTLRTVTATIGGVPVPWTNQTAGTTARTGILYTFDGSTFESNEVNKLRSTFTDAMMSSVVDGLDPTNIVFDKTGGAHDNPASMPTRKTDVRNHGPHWEITDAYGNAPGTDKGIVYTLYPPHTKIVSEVNSVPTPVDLRYDLHGTGNVARSRGSVNPTQAIYPIWESRANPGLGHRETLWIGFCLWFPADYKVDGRADGQSGAKGTRHQFFEWFSRVISKDVSLCNMQIETFDTTIANGEWGVCVNLSRSNTAEDALAGTVGASSQYNGTITSTFSLGWDPESEDPHNPANWIGKRNYFVVQMHTDDRSPAAGGSPLFRMWHSTDDDGPELIIDMSPGGRSRGTVVNMAEGVHVEPVRYGAYIRTTDPANAPNNSGGKNDNDGYYGILTSFRTYKPGWYTNWYTESGTEWYRGQLRPDIIGTYSQVGTTLTVTVTDPLPSLNTYQAVLDGDLITLDLDGDAAGDSDAYTVSNCDGYYTTGGLDTGRGMPPGFTFDVTLPNSRTASGNVTVKGDKVIHGISSFRIGDSTSDFASVHPLGTAPP